ncbi:hypothetical protein [Mycolicibacterium sp. XJ775]
MINEPVAQLIADNLPGLIHPGDNKGPIPLPLPMFRNAHIPADMAKQMADEAGLPSFDIAKLTGEAISHLLTSNGWTVRPTAEWEKLEADAAAAPDGTRIEPLYDEADRGKPKDQRKHLAQLTITKNEGVYVPTRLLRKALDQ